MCGCHYRVQALVPETPSKPCSTNPSSSGGGPWRRRGAVLTGKVLDAKASDQFQEAGYLRLALTAIFINGKFLPIQTSSIFMKRGSHEQRNVTILRDGAGKKRRSHRGIGGRPGTTYATGSMDVGVAPERSLTFRLAQPLAL